MLHNLLISVLIPELDGEFGLVRPPFSHSYFVTTSHVPITMDGLQRSVFVYQDASLMPTQLGCASHEDSSRGDVQPLPNPIEGGQKRKDKNYIFV